MAPKKTSSDCKRTRRGGKGGAQKETAPCCLSPSLSISLVSLLARSLLTALFRSSAFPLTEAEAAAAGKAAADDSIDKGRRTDGRTGRPMDDGRRQNAGLSLPSASSRPELWQFLHSLPKSFSRLLPLCPLYLSLSSAVRFCPSS